MFAYLKREHALSAQQLLGGERVQQQHRAACRIQAVARGISTRTRVAGMWCCDVVVVFFVLIVYMFIMQPLELNSA